MSITTNLKGDAARSQFVNLFKNVQRLKTQLDQYTDLDEEQKEKIETLIPKEQMQGFKGVYLETAQRLKAQQRRGDKDTTPEVQELDFEFALFASEVIDYDYIMKLIAEYSQTQPEKREMSRQQLIGLIRSDAKFMNEGEDIVAYINSLEEGVGLSEQHIHEGYESFKEEKHAEEMTEIAEKHGLDVTELQDFIDNTLRRMIFDDEELSTLLSPLGLDWKARAQKKLALMENLSPLLRKRGAGRVISGLSAYEQ